jgi:hypothetical protein
MANRSEIVAIENQKTIYCFLQIDYTDTTIQFHIFENPSTLFGPVNKVSAEYHKAVAYNVLVNNEIKKTYITRTNEKFINANGQEIQIIQLFNPCEILPDAFYHIRTKNPLYSNYYITYPLTAGTYIEPIVHNMSTLIGDLQSRRVVRHLPIEEIIPRAPPPKKTIVPQRVINTFIESAIEKGECCPITMTPLEKSNTFVTPCWHSMSLSAKRWIDEKSQCPLCKQPCQSDNIMQWIPL